MNNNSTDDFFFWDDRLIHLLSYNNEYIDVRIDNRSKYEVITMISIQIMNKLFNSNNRKKQEIHHFLRFITSFNIIENVEWNKEI